MDRKVIDGGRTLNDLLKAVYKAIELCGSDATYHFTDEKDLIIDSELLDYDVYIE